MHVAEFNTHVDIGDEHAHRYSRVRFINLKALCSDSEEKRGLEPSVFETVIKDQCSQARKVLEEK